MEDANEKKQIQISGTSNRYQIKKLTNPNDPKKKRVLANKWNLSDEFWIPCEQLKLLKELVNLDERSVIERSVMHKLVISQVETKLNGYKQQDLLKKLHDETRLIKLEEIIEKLIDCELKCFYCKKETRVLYEIVREVNQWTLDRIDNSIGHFTDNVVISCLDCNLKRKKQNSDKFLFTKQLQIVRSV